MWMYNVYILYILRKIGEDEGVSESTFNLTNTRFGQIQRTMPLCTKFILSHTRRYYVCTLYMHLMLTHIHTFARKHAKRKTCWAVNGFMCEGKVIEMRYCDTLSVCVCGMC